MLQCIKITGSNALYRFQRNLKMLFRFWNPLFITCTSNQLLNIVKRYSANKELRVVSNCPVQDIVSLNMKVMIMQLNEFKWCGCGQLYFTVNLSTIRETNITWSEEGFEINKSETNINFFIHQGLFHLWINRSEISKNLTSIIVSVEKLTSRA